MDNLRIALFVVKFDPMLKSPTLTDELCESFDSQGHSVDVFFLDWGKEYATGILDAYRKARVHIIAPVAGQSNLVSRLLRWTFSSWGVYQYYRSHFKVGDHDLLVVVAPPIMFGFALLMLKRAYKYRILIQWDFFPFHQEQIGLIPFKWITHIGAFLETRLLSTFSFIGCMSQRNVDYLTSHYRISQSVQTGIVPLWAKIRPKPIVDKSAIRKQYGLPQSIPITVFGGQIAPGRGIEDVVAAAELASEADLPIHFLFVGKGPKLEWLLERSKRSNAKFSVLSYVPRDKYLELIASCDAGIVATIRDVDVPTFPSKSLDYCCVGLPIIASVEKSTDFGEIVATSGVGFSCEAGDSRQMLALCLKLFADGQTWSQFSNHARQFYEENFDVQQVTANLVKKTKNASNA